MTAAARVVIVGGGIAGLTAAYRLQQAAAGLSITLIEAEPRLGGKIQTERPDGFVIEAGPDSFLAAKPAAANLCQELGIDDQIIGTTPDGGGTYILRDGRLEPLPEGITGLVPTKVGPLIPSRLLSTRAKLRLAAEILIPPRRDDGDESVASFVRRRFGNEAFERMAQPLLSGIYAGDAEQMSLLATFPRLRESERKHGSLIRGMIKQRRAAASTPPPSAGGPRRSGFLSLAHGLGTLIEALSAALTEVDLRVGTPATAVERGVGGGYTVHLADGTTLPADAVLLATPAWATAALVAGLDDDLARLTSEIPYVSSATVALAYRRSDVGPVGSGRGFVIPQVENRQLTAITWVTNKFPGRAPDDLMLLRAFVGRAGREHAVNLPDDGLLRLVQNELRGILKLTAEPVMTRIHRWQRAMPQYVLGHNERLAQIDQRLTTLPGLRLLGASYRGVGIPDCIVSGEQAAEQTLSYLQETALAAR